jgi:hypothetical protein
MNLYLEELAEETKFLRSSKDPASLAAAASAEADPEEQWAWLVKVMEEAKRKGQNVSLNL